MRRLLLVHYYHDVEFFVPLLQHLRALLYRVETFGLFAARDAGPGYFRELMDRVREHDVVWFWTNFLTRDQLKCLRLCFPGKLFVRYTWYPVEPYNHMEREYFDLYFSSSRGHGTYLPPGVDTRHFRPRAAPKEWDVACYAHTISPPRERALEALRHAGLRVALFGGPAVGEMYPDLYQGEVPYDSLPDSIAAARIVLVLNHSPGDCITDTFFKALACGALVLTNVNKAPFYGRCVIADEGALVEQVRALLQEDHAVTQHRARVLARQFDWAQFAERVHVKIAERLFDCEFYLQTFEHSFPPDTRPDAVFEYWRCYGLPQLEVPFRFEIPPDDLPRIAHLRAESRRRSTHAFLAGKSDHYLCWHLRAASEPAPPSEDAEVPAHVLAGLEAVFRGAPLSSLRLDPAINAHVRAFFAQ